jgi:hypothetical protein
MRVAPSLVALAAGALALSAAGVRPAEAQEVAETTPAPSFAADEVERYPPSSVRPKLIVGGLTLTGLAYGAAALSGTQWDDVPGADALKIPVVGPWIALGQNDCAPDDPDCGFILYFRGFLTILDGIIQAGGLGIAGEGLFMTTEADAVEAPAREASFLESVRPVPVVTGTATGLGLAGAF